MSEQVKNIKPVYGENYRIGDVGFVRTSGSFVSTGIAYFEQFGTLAEIKVSHALGVTGPDECVEAMPNGIERNKLSTYFDNPKCQIFFRRWRGWTPELGRIFADEIGKHVGHKYGYWIIVAQFLGRNFLGRALNAIFAGYPNRWITKCLQGKTSAEMCSQLMCLGAKASPVELIGAEDWTGCLKLPPAEVTPQMLFEDDAVFKPWKR